MPRGGNVVVIRLQFILRGWFIIVFVKSPKGAGLSFRPTAGAVKHTSDLNRRD